MTRARRPGHCTHDRACYEAGCKNCCGHNTRYQQEYRKRNQPTLRLDLEDMIR